jgi:hypothetical protein
VESFVYPEFCYSLFGSLFLLDSLIYRILYNRMYLSSWIAQLSSSFYTYHCLLVFYHVFFSLMRAHVRYAWKFFSRIMQNGPLACDFT